MSCSVTDGTLYYGQCDTPPVPIVGTPTKDSRHVIGRLVADGRVVLDSRLFSACGRYSKKHILALANPLQTQSPP